MNIFLGTDFKEGQVVRKYGSYDNFVERTFEGLKEERFGQPQLNDDMVEPYVWAASARVGLRMAELKRAGIGRINEAEVAQCEGLSQALVGFAAEHRIDTDGLHVFVKNIVEAAEKEHANSQK